MNKIRCEMCGSTELVKQDGLFVCQYCGCKYSPEEAKKLMVVKIDQTENLKNLYLLARRARAENNTELAQKYYEQIIVNDPTSWEASFYVVYCTAINCKVGQIGSAAYSVKNCIGSTFQLIKENVEESKQKEIYTEIKDNVETLASMLLRASEDHFCKHNGSWKEISTWNDNILFMMETLGDRLNYDFRDTVAAISAYKKALVLKSQYNSSVGNDWVTSIQNKILKIDSSYQNELDRAEMMKEYNTLLSKSAELEKAVEGGKPEALRNLKIEGWIFTILVIGIIIMSAATMELHLFEVVIIVIFGVLAWLLFSSIPDDMRSAEDAQKQLDRMRELEKKLQIK